MTTPDPAERDGERLPWTQRLYIGNGYFDIVGKRMRWYIGFGLLVLVCIASLGLKGFNLGIDFEGGTKIQMPAVSAQGGPIEVNDAEDAFAEAIGQPPETTQLVGSGGSQTIQIRTESLNAEEVGQVKQTLFSELQPVGPAGAPSMESISDSAVSGTWGGEITQQALLALVVFLVLVAVFLGFYFERWMAVAALVALLHDVVVTAGVYSLIGFEVTPSTVIGLLTILGFSLYDTVVVFDKVRENTRGLLGLTRRTYPEAANLAVNQTLIRSVNTSVIALLPVLGLLVVGAGLLGVGVLRDLALVQLIGMIAGVVSSILLATPLLVDLKMRESKYQEHAVKVQRRREREAAGESAEPAAESTAAGSTSGGPEVAVTSSRGSAREPGSKRDNRPSAKSRPSGKSGRPSGKKRR